MLHFPCVRRVCLSLFIQNFSHFNWVRFVVVGCHGWFYQKLLHKFEINFHSTLDVFNLIYLHLFFGCYQFPLSWSCVGHLSQHIIIALAVWWFSSSIDDALVINFMTSCSTVLNQRIILKNFLVVFYIDINPVIISC